MRKKFGLDKANEEDGVVGELRQLVSRKKSVINNDYARFILEAATVLTGKPGFLVDLILGELIYDPLAVIVLLDDKSGHKQPFPKPYIVLHGSNRHFLGIAVDRCGYAGSTQRLATPEDVENCIENLNEAQIKYILTNDLFRPALSPLFEEPEELVVEKT
jgi:hypothetical protein